MTRLASRVASNARPVSGSFALDRRGLCHLIASRVVGRLIPRPVATLDLLQSMTGCALAPAAYLKEAKVQPMRMHDSNEARRVLLDHCWLRTPDYPLHLP
jgi:hypothetical protein